MFSGVKLQFFLLSPIGGSVGMDHDGCVARHYDGCNVKDPHNLNSCHIEKRGCLSYVKCKLGSFYFSNCRIIFQHYDLSILPHSKHCSRLIKEFISYIEFIKREFISWRLTHSLSVCLCISLCYLLRLLIKGRQHDELDNPLFDSLTPANPP